MNFSGCLILHESANKYYRMKPETLKLYFRGVGCVCVSVSVSVCPYPNPYCRQILYQLSHKESPRGRAEIETDLSRDVQALGLVYEPSCRGRPPSPGDAEDLG